MAVTVTLLTPLGITEKAVVVLAQTTIKATETGAVAVISVEMAVVTAATVVTQVLAAAVAAVAEAIVVAAVLAVLLLQVQQAAAAQAEAAAAGLLLAPHLVPQAVESAY